MSDPISQNRSMFNPTDAAMAVKSGQVGPDMPVGQYLEQQFGVKWDDPVQVAAQKMAGAAKKADPRQKMAAIAGGGQAPPPGQPPQPAGRKPMVQSGGMEGLMNSMGKPQGV